MEHPGPWREAGAAVEQTGQNGAGGPVGIGGGPRSGDGDRGLAAVETPEPGPRVNNRGRRVAGEDDTTVQAALQWAGE